MCGFFGSAVAGRVQGSSGTFEAALGFLRHRGPDDQRVVELSGPNWSVVLGHTRLAVIDLSGDASQPMTSSDGRFVISFNGEIYNYREIRTELTELGAVFRSDSDTEVLLAAWAQWGENSLPRLVGMFAFAVVDLRLQTMTLVRDAFGIKPLYFACSNGQVSFASEIPALLEVLEARPELDYQRLSDYLLWGRYDHTAGSFVDGVSQVLPAHLVRFDLERLATRPQERWWWPSIAERTDLTFEQAAFRFRELFLESVRLHLRSDVPIGAALSGGLDSSAVVCAMRHLEPELALHTFTYVARGSALDEERWADLVNEHVGAIPHKVVIEAEDLQRDLDDMIRAQGEPFGGTSIYAQYRVFQAARVAGIVVTQDGQGADELLAGYDGYPRAYVRSLMGKGQFLSVPEFLLAWMKWPGRGPRRAVSVMVSAMTPRWLRSFGLRVAGIKSGGTWFREGFFRAKGVCTAAPELRQRTRETRGREVVADLRDALTGSGLSSLLRHGDRNSMHWSVESRVPFLTIELAEFVLSLPEEYLISPKGETKRLLRAAMRGLVPDQVLDRRDKIGFQTPEDEWLRWQVNATRECLADFPIKSILGSEKIQNDLDLFEKGRLQLSGKLWRVLNLCRWSKINGVGEDSDSC